MYEGSEKYFVNSILGNFVPMYIKGDALLTSIQLIPLFLWFYLTGDPTSPSAIANYVERAIMTLLPNPDWMFLNFFINPLLGAAVSTMNWSHAMNRR